MNPEDLEDLAFTSLVPLTDRKVKYVLEWDSGDPQDGQAEAFAFVVMKRAGGLLAAVPMGFLADEVLSGTALAISGLVGPATTVKVPGILLEEGPESRIGADIEVLLVDLDASVASQFRVAEAEEEVAMSFSQEDPFADPDTRLLISAAESWVSSTTGVGAAMESEAWYSADQASVPDTPRARRRKPTQPGGDTPLGSGPKARRPTTASLQASLDTVLATLPRLSETMKSLADRQSSLETQLVATPAVSRSLAQPLSAQVATSQQSTPKVLQGLSPPPRVQTSAMTQGLTSVPSELLELEADKQEKGQGAQLAQAMLAQSAALTTLVAQLANASQDPLSDLQSSSSTGTRGSTGRARLQAELAQQRGLFFDAVMKSMSRRMAPTSVADRAPAELLANGISGTKYLERFGGYGRFKELGLIQYQLMTALDFAMAENWPAVKDTLALLIVCVEQAVLDSGRFEVAQILTLQEDVPASVFTNRQLATTSRARSFAPLSDPRWITTAIAFLKELETISAKRTELLTHNKESASSIAPAPKPKAKRKGGGKGNRQQNQVGEEEEQ